jgi:hypothetical protein
VLVEVRSGWMVSRWEFSDVRVEEEKETYQI